MFFWSFIGLSSSPPHDDHQQRRKKNMEFGIKQLHCRRANARKKSKGAVILKLAPVLDWFCRSNARIPRPIVLRFLISLIPLERDAISPSLTLIFLPFAKHFFFPPELRLYSDSPSRVEEILFCCIWRINNKRGRRSVELI